MATTSFRTALVAWSVSTPVAKYGYCRIAVPELMFRPNKRPGTCHATPGATEMAETSDAGNDGLGCRNIMLVSVTPANAPLCIREKKTFNLRSAIFVEFGSQLAFSQMVYTESYGMDLGLIRAEEGTKIEVSEKLPGLDRGSVKEQEGLGREPLKGEESSDSRSGQIQSRLRSVGGITDRVNLIFGGRRFDPPSHPVLSVLNDA
ncbi:hypothetical protein BKA59DRAFT_460350 [Fusarium tricinctum]|uniref:Uncharacterized protein n=1 Tax=Fusarium tricinctum TaxID=61284 RepID=A0A8K0RMM1_9HYPO|nr:hypothetical protein BKA59DRAFT_460350 [Fusarium tricinctum]